MQISEITYDPPGLPFGFTEWEEDRIKRGITKRDTWAKMHLCRKGTRFGNGRMFNTPCGQWRICPECYRHRILKWYRRIEDARMQYKGTWRIHVYKTEIEATCARRMLRVYDSFPTYDGYVIVSPEFADGDILPDNDAELLYLLHLWVVTPLGKRPSYAPCKKRVHDEKETSTTKQFFTTAPISEVRETVKKLGGKTFDTKSEIVEYTNNLVDDVQIAYELLIDEYLVYARGENRLIEPLTVHDTIFDEVRDKRAEEVGECHDLDWMLTGEDPPKGW